MSWSREAEELDPHDTLSYGTRWREFGRTILEDSFDLPANQVREGESTPVKCGQAMRKGQESLRLGGFRFLANSSDTAGRSTMPVRLAGDSLHRFSDIDEDGVGDLVVGTPGVTAQKVEAGGAVVLGSQAIGEQAALSDELILHQIVGVEAHAFLGASVSTTPDFDGDGIAEILLATPEHTVWELKGGLGVAVGSTRFLETEEYVFDPEGAIESAVGIAWGGSEGEGFGRSVLGMDLNNDDYGDMILAIHNEDVQQPGSVRVVSGQALAAGGPTYMEATIANIMGIPGAFGQAMALLPDGDGDGVDELLISAPLLNNQNGTLMVMGSQDIAIYDSVHSRQDTSANDLAIRMDGSDSEEFGTALAGGVWEEQAAALVGAPSAGGGDGAAYLVLPYDPDSRLNPVELRGSGGEGWGEAVAFVGDTDRDGVEEVAVGAPASSVTFDEAGAVIFFALDDLTDGGVFDLEDAVRVLYGEEANENTGASLLNAGDMNGDGWDDLAIGATRLDAPDGWNEGGFSLWVRP